MSRYMGRICLHTRRHNIYVIHINPFINNIHPKMNIIVQTYNETNDARNAEYELCLLNNLNHFNVKAVYNLYESEASISEKVRTHPKYIGIHLGRRMTYGDAFEFAKKEIPPNEIVGIINLDICVSLAFDLSQLRALCDFDTNIVAVSRHEINMSNGLPHLDPQFATVMHANNQDGWFFKNPVLQGNYDIQLGRLGCDNAIAAELKSSGYNVLNMAERFVIIHHDSARGKTASNFMEFHKNEEVKYNGGMLVPNYDIVRHMGADKLMAEMGFTEIERVMIITEIVNRRLKIRNV